MTRLLRIVVLAGAIMISCSSAGGNSSDSSTDEATSASTDTIPLAPVTTAPPASPAEQALLAAYPDFIERIEDNTVFFRDGSRMEYDDKREKDFDTMLDDSDIEDMFFVRYDSRTSPPEYLHDAGRSRSEALFKKMYGASANAVRSNLVKVNWMGKTVDFTRVNGAADSLRQVAEELSTMPELRKYLDSSGTFYWRSVRGAKRLSAHSYGIAFDIAVPYSDYWLWKNPGAHETDRITYSNRIPRKLVEVFERHGFIWGGAWYHFDTMHFEFRPEILHYSALLEH